METSPDKNVLDQRCSNYDMAKMFAGIVRSKGGYVLSVHRCPTGWMVIYRL